MTELLVKLFVKDKEQIEEQSVRTSYGVLASIVGIICNVFLFAIKFVIGFVIQSITVTADSFNNLSDAASSIISFVGVKVANRPADKEHPFGHGRAEYISALIVAFLVIQVGFTCFKSALDKIFHPSLIDFNPILVAILAISVLVKVWLSLFNRKLGRRIDSKVMLATSADARGDAIITSATVLSIIIGHASNLAIDGYAGLVVSIFVLISGFNIAKDTLEPLLGEAIDKELYHDIKSKVEGYEGILGSHDLIVHTYGPTRRMATIHAEVPNNMSIESAHELIDKIEREVFRDMNVFLVIHMDPLEVDNEVVLAQKKMVVEVIHELDPNATLHDFRVVTGEHWTNIIFDLVISFSYKPEEEKKLLAQIRERVHALDSRYHCLITVENSYVEE